MNQLIRRSAVPALLLMVLAVGCGTTQQVDSSTGAHGVAREAVAHTAASTTTTTAAPAGVPLWQLPSTGEGIVPMHGPVKMSTTVYDNSVYDPLGCTSGVLWAFDLNKGYDKLTGTIGLDDNSPSTDNITVTITGDNGAVLNTTVAKLGTVTPISVGLGGQLRLQVAITGGGGNCNPATGFGSTIAIGNALLTKAGG